MRRRKEKGGTSASGAQSWRELAGPSRRRVNSPQARKRRTLRWLRISTVFLISVFVILGITALVLKVKNQEEAISLTPPSKPIEQIIFSTDGVLPNAWLNSVLDLRVGMTLMEADIHLLKEQLEAFGQVQSASVERVFPNALKVVVKERDPVMRMKALGKDGKEVERIVARDGTLYKGVGYPKAMVENLPYLQPYMHTGGSYFPMKGIDKVADLLDLFRLEQPTLYQTWKLVSLEYYSGDLEMPGEIIEIHSTKVPRIVFSASKDFSRQIDRLIYILKHVRNRGNPSIERIDLSLNDSAAVQFSSGRISTF